MSLAADARAFARLRPRDLTLTARAAAGMWAARRDIRGGRLAQALAEKPALSGAGEPDPIRIAAAVRRVDRVVPGTDRCLPCAIALRRLLAAEGHASELRIGVERGTPGVSAHAWVEHDGRPLLEPRPVDAYDALSAPGL